MEGWPQAAKDKIVDLERKLSESERLRRGTYYSVLDGLGKRDVLSFQQPQGDPNPLDVVRRTTECERYKTAIETAKNWDSTKEIATASGKSAYSASSLTTAGMDDGSRRRHTKKLKTIAIDGNERTSGEIAHMLAFSSKCSGFCGDLGEAAAGVSFVDHRAERQQALIHGVLEDRPRRKHSAKLERVEGSGMKHYLDNMARIVHQGLYCNNKPSVLVLPILDLPHVKSPPPDGYDVIVVCTTPSVYQEMVLTEKVEPLATETEIRWAFARLNEFLDAAAVHLISKSESDIKRLPAKEATAVKPAWTLATQYKRCPKFVLADDLSDVAVLKTRFSNKEGDQHSFVDPWLLLLKNAAMFSDMAGFKLLPGCDFSNDSTERSVSDSITSSGGIPAEIDVSIA